MSVLVLAGAVTFAFTTVLTIAGVGAAFILIPVFVAVGIDLHAAMATALLLNAIAMSVACIRFVRRRLVIFEVALPILVVATIASPVGVWVSRSLDRTVLLWLFVGFLTLAGALMLFYVPRAREARRGPAAQLGVGVGVGGAAGFLGGLLGVGGGNVVVPALVTLGVEPKRASATTSFIVIFSSLSGFLGHVSLGGVEPGLLAWTAAGAVAGAALGSWLMSERLQSRQVKVLVGIVLLAIALKMARDLL
jgi:uncharacterized membrane protein YfcA